MPEQGIRSTYSQCPFQIHLCDRGGIISTGSGFFFELASEWFLITNWHNISGRHAFSKRPLGRSRRFPWYLDVKLATYLAGTEKFTTVAHRVEIYEDGKPRWFEHPNLGSDCDVIALPFERPELCPPFMHNAANLISSTRVPVQPGTTVFIVGFPRSISVGIGLPLWKSGYIASEPYYDATIEGEISDLGGLTNGRTIPAFFIDSQTREGMSGAPVFASYTGAWDTAEPYGPLSFDAPNFFNRTDVILSGTASEFVGCYSGRVGVEEEGAALGLCWRKDVIELICHAKKPGDNPHEEVGTPSDGRENP